jgi:tryptophan synthase alpha chain
MDRIQRAFKTARKEAGRAALIPFLNAGDPSLDASLALFQTVLQAGADIIEIGTPYSDPLADGPVIQRSALRSLKAGFQFPHSFELASALRPRGDHGQILFTYVNPLLQYGVDQFFRDADLAGVDGVIVPDLPCEESAEVRAAADKRGVALIPLVAPTSRADRIGEICEGARGFVYCVSSLGVTGERSRMSSRVEQLVQTVREHTELPVAVGFGVSTREQARAIAGFADGVIVGSAFIRRIERTLANEPCDVSILSQCVYDFAIELLDGIAAGPGTSAAVRGAGQNAERGEDPT